MGCTMVYIPHGPWVVQWYIYIRKMTSQAQCTWMCLHCPALHKIIFIFSMDMYRMTVREMGMELPYGFIEAH